MACHVNVGQSHGKREAMGKPALRACQSLLVFLLFCWGRKSSVLCLTLHVKLGVILRSVCFGYFINHITSFVPQLLHTSIFLSTTNLTRIMPQLRLLTRGHCHGMA